ncbi:UDP-N-acetylmuramate dehydrogenase [Ruminococcus sp.]|uniref:UDP-N-acetylmuramate dehydrogenase n=1 Tax=Ruminococcus sp. TaxID=41978 RepID=UPI00386F4130
MKNLIEKLNDRNIYFVLNEPMSAHTTFKIGGAADILITVKSIDELQAAINACKASNLPVMILGNGSNLLVSDNGIEGAVITLDGDFKEITVDGDIITSGAGAKLSRLCSVALENSLTGLEFAYGIPGTVGGAMYMNAGAYGGEMKDVALSVTALTADGMIREVPAEDLQLGYRTSVFKTNGDIILFSKYKLEQGDQVAIKARMDDVMDRRKTKQPLEFPSAGSVFKRPEGAFAGTLIEQCGLKGKTVGGAQVSEKHAGFIINIGGATCDDVMGLVKIVQDTVKAETGYFLEREIIRTGRQ